MHTSEIPNAKKVPVQVSVSESIQVSRIPFTLPVTLSRTVSALCERAATRESGAPPVNYGSFTRRHFPPQHTRPRDGKPLSLDTCTKVEWSCIFAVNSGLNEKDFLTCAGWMHPSPTPSCTFFSCASPPPLVSSSRLCFLSPPFGLFYLSHCLSLSFSQHLCESTCVAAEDPAVVMAFLSLSLSLSSWQRGSNWIWCQWHGEEKDGRN